MTPKFILALTLFAATLPLAAQNAPNHFLDAPDDGHVAVPLWPAGAPGALGNDASDIPTLNAYLPKSNPTHTAVIVVPGGGYSILALNHEGAQIGVWLADHGIAAFIVKYRLGPRYHHPIELGDAQRALRTVRAHAAQYGVDKDHIGMWGFSAGGHLVGMVGTHFDAGNAQAADPIDRVSDRPDFVISSYGALTLQQGVAKPSALRPVLGVEPTPEILDEVSPDKHVTAQTPPYFLYATTTDQAVPPLSSVVFYTALVRAGVPAEIHIFQQGPHGTALAQSYPALSAWPGLLENWLRQNGWIAASTPVSAH